MKKSFAFILMICLVALLVGTLVACDPAGGQTTYDPEDPTGRTYTVTFDVNGATVVPEALLSPITGVKYGDTLAQPLVEGTNLPAEPFKRGYTFDGWTVNGVKFQFGKDQITGPTTLRASFIANTFYHYPDIYTTWSYDEATGEYKANPNGHVKLNEQNEPTYVDGEFKIDARGQNVLDDNGQPLPRPQSYVILGEAEYSASTTTFTSTYGSTPSKALAVPTKTLENGEPDTEDEFCFWYYMAEDEEGKKYPVQYTDWAKSGNSTVDAKKISYTLTAGDDQKGIALYAMFESDLPKVTVEYYVSEDDVDNAVAPVKTAQYNLNANVPQDQVASPDAPVGKELDHWYFVYFTEGEDGEKVRNVEKFIFEQLDEDGNPTNTDATSPMDAAHPDPEVVPESEVNFRPVTLRLFAKWVRKIVLADAASFSGLRAEILDCVENDKAADLDEILHAKITLSADIDLGSTIYEPLFDEAHPFEGSIDGGLYDGEEGAFTRNLKISGGIFSYDGHASVFGYVNGDIKNINFESITVSVTGAPYMAYLGIATSVLRGSIEHCTVTGAAFELGEGITRFAAGGLTAVLGGVSSDETGSINECDVNLTFEALVADGIYVGGAAGIALPSTSISNVNATIAVESITANASQGTDIGVWLGGIAGECNADAASCEGTLTVTTLVAKGRLFVGGLFGQNMGATSRSFGSLTLGSAETPAEAGSEARSQKVAIGGAIGLNGGSIINSYSNASIFVKVARSADTSVALGGLIGENRSDRDDNQSGQEVGVGAINRCYSTGAISVTVAETVKDAHIFAGGIAGYSKHSKFARNFTLVDLTVNYNVENVEELVNAGFIFGKLATSAVFTSGYYSVDNRVTINGVVYQPKDPSQSTEQPEEEKDMITRLGKVMNEESFADTDFLFGTAADQLGWVGGKEDGNIWKLDEGAALPTLV